MSDDRRTDASGAEPRQEDPASGAGQALGRRSFAGENMAADERRQAQERGAGLGAGGAANRDARHPAGEDAPSTRGLERDGNGDPLGGMVPEDDID